jgi:ATP-dependent exoDNAse (exonuclease V) alpha subunit
VYSTASDFGFQDYLDEDEEFDQPLEEYEEYYDREAAMESCTEVCNAVDYLLTEEQKDLCREYCSDVLEKGKGKKAAPKKKAAAPKAAKKKAAAKAKKPKGPKKAAPPAKKAPAKKPAAKKGKKPKSQEIWNYLLRRIMYDE